MRSNVHDGIQKAHRLVILRGKLAQERAWDRIPECTVARWAGSHFNIDALPQNAGSRPSSSGSDSLGSLLTCQEDNGSTRAVGGTVTAS